MDTLPATRTALVQSDSQKGAKEIRSGIPLPSISPTQVLVKTTHVALQPCDFKMPARAHIPSAVIGNDYAGRIVALGSSVPSHLDLHVGDRVYGFVHGNNPQTPDCGSFSEFLAAEAEHVWKTPERVGDEVASTLASRIATCALAFKALGLVGRPWYGGGMGEVVLVYGGSTSVGQLIIRALKMSGYTPIATCSPVNFPLVRSQGAKEAFDYKDPNYISQVRSFTNRSLKFVIDCISESPTVKDCLAMISRAGGKFVGLEYFPDNWNTRPKTVQASYFYAWEVLGKDVNYLDMYGTKGDEAVKEYGQEWMAKMQGVIENNFLDIPIQVLPGRFDAILVGLQVLENRKVSAKKMVVKIEE